MNIQSKFISSIRQHLDIIENLESELGSICNFTKNKIFLKLNKTLKETVRDLQAEIEEVKEEIGQLTEDIQRIRRLQDCSKEKSYVFCGFSGVESLAEKKRYFLAQRNMILKQYFSDLKQNAQENLEYKSFFFKLNKVETNNFRAMNKFVIENFRELKLYKENKQFSKPRLTVTTALTSSYSDISIHTPLKQIIDLSVTDPPPLTTYKPLTTSVSKSCISDHLAQHTNVNTQYIRNNEDFQLHNGCSIKKSTSLYGLMSPVHLINQDNSTLNSCQETQTPVIPMITPTKPAFRNIIRTASGEENVLPNTISSSLLKFV